MTEIQKNQFKTFLNNFINNKLDYIGDRELDNYLNMDCEVVLFQLPILKIDGLNVNVKINTVSDSLYITVIHKFKKLYQEYIGDFTSKEEVLGLIDTQNYFIWIADLKYNNLIGNFIKNNGDNLFMDTNPSEYILEKMGLDLEDCCVCLEKTTTKLKKCNHTICIECIGKLEVIQHFSKCPLCRSKFTSNTLDIVNQADLLSKFRFR